jgi:hypothetical protein
MIQPKSGTVSLEVLILHEARIVRLAGKRIT